MSVKTIAADEIWIVTENTQLQSLTIAPGGALAAPDGKTLTMTLDGRGQRPLPGHYEGDIQLTVADTIPKVFFIDPEHPLDFRAGIYINDGAYQQEQSVPAIVQAGTVTGDRISDVTMEGYDESFTGILVDGDSEVTIENVKIDFTGNGENDFIGNGAGIKIDGNAKVTINNADVHTKGVTRNTLFIGGHSDVTINDSRFVSESTNEMPQGYVEGMGLGTMKRVPWVMGMRGTCRATNLADYGVVRYNRCYLESDGWGVLSVDASDVVRMYVKDSEIVNRGPSGYGAFSIGDSIDTFDHCVFRTGTYALVMSQNNSGGVFTNGTVVNSKYGVIIFRNDGGTCRVEKGCVFNTSKACFIVKGARSNLEVDGAVLNPGNGIILQLMDNDEQSNCLAWYKEPIGEVDQPVEGRDLTAFYEREDLRASFSNMAMTGNIYNSTTALYANCRAPKSDMEMMFDGVPPEQCPRGLGRDLQGPKNLHLTLSNVRHTGLITCSTQRHNVLYIDMNNCEELSEVNHTPAEPVNNGLILTLENGCDWTLTGTCYMTKLTLGEDCTVRAEDGKSVTMTVDGVETPIAAGEYVGKIVLAVK